jgi:hypothetical protein
MVRPFLRNQRKLEIGSGPAIFILIQTSDRAVINHFAVFIAPAAINHLADRDFVHIARDDAVHELGGVLARNQIFVEWRDIDQRARVADRVVLVLMMYFIHADGVVSRPFPVVQAMAEGKRSFMKGSSNWQRSTSRGFAFPVTLLPLSLGISNLNDRGQRDHGGNVNAELYAVTAFPASLGMR